MKLFKENRQSVITILAISMSFFQLTGQSVLPESRHYKLEKLAEGVYAAIHNDYGGYAICNAGIIDLGDKTIITDPFMSPSAARDLKQHAEALTGRPVSMVLNLDPHSDHTRGNQVFFPDADIIGTVNARRIIEDTFQSTVDDDKLTAPAELEKITEQLKEVSGDERAELMMWYGYHKAKIESFEELKMVPPNITITDTMVIYGSERSLIVFATGIGHTAGDMVAYLPEESIIFMGDLLFNERHPYMGDGDPESWRNTLNKIVLLKPETAVPGHGPVGDINSIHSLIEYIEILTDMVEQEIEKGAVEKKIVELPVPEKFENWLFGQFYQSSLQTLYRKLKEKAR
ncbi:MAG: MBL fold metallo-hydrolase [Bacteroidales bacterium]|nr:MBL fold metallo-hydrolase [Bacteroidales bacterium]